MIMLSELQLKEIIVIHSGRRLGHINDLEIDPDTGRIVAIITYVRDNKGSLFGKTNEMYIYWHQIVTIGKDVILVNNDEQTEHQAAIE